MSERSQLISRLEGNTASRASYIRAKINVLLPAQLRALRLRRPLKQAEFAKEAGMKQSRISAMECPGAVNFTIETLVRAAAALKVGLVVKFVPFSEMVRWENNFNQDSFDVAPIDRDVEFITGNLAPQLVETTTLLTDWFRSFGVPLRNYIWLSQESLSRPEFESDLVKSGVDVRPMALNALSSIQEENRPNLTSELAHRASQDPGEPSVSHHAANNFQQQGEAA